MRVRSGIVASLDALEAAGTGLRWARYLFPPRTREEQGWRVLVDLLDRLDAGARTPKVELARSALHLLDAVGYGMDFDRCVRCGKECPEGRPAYVDPAHGGLVCRACGGSRRVLDPAVRKVARALQHGEETEVTDAQAAEILTMIDEAMAAHAGFEK